MDQVEAVADICRAAFWTSVTGRNLAALCLFFGMMAVKLHSIWGRNCFIFSCGGGQLLAQINTWLKILLCFLLSYLRAEWYFLQVKGDFNDDDSREFGTIILIAVLHSRT